MSKLLYLYLSAVRAPRDVAEPPLTDDLQALHVALVVIEQHKPDATGAEGGPQGRSG